MFARISAGAKPLLKGLRNNYRWRQGHTRSVHTPQTLSRKSSSFLLFAGGIVTGSAAVILSSVTSSAANDSSSDNHRSLRSTKPVDDLGVTEYADHVELEKALQQIRSVIGENSVQTQQELLQEHADSSWQTRHPLPNEIPAAIVFPKSTAEVSEVIKVANQYKVPVTAYCGGTSLEGHFTPVYGGISLDLSNMNQILKVHEDDLDVVVQPAVGWEELNDKLKDYGLMFGTDAGPGASIAGMVNTGASGINAFFYGPMRHNVVNLTVVLADGTVIKTKKRPRKSSAGYNLAELFIGSEGTLGIVTEVTLKLSPIPAHSRVGLLTFQNVADATLSVQDMLKLGLAINAMELLDDEQMKIINASGTTERKWDENHTLILRFAGATTDTIESSIAKAKEVSVKHNMLRFDFARTEDESVELWSARKNALWSVQGAFPEKVMWTTDVAVPISNLSQIISDAKGYVTDAGIVSSVVGHVGDGNFHLLIAYDPKTEKAAAAKVAEQLVRRAIELDGTCTGEHGVGAGKRQYLLEEVGPESVALMRQIKAALDPNTILNPGKIFQTSLEDISDHA